MVLQRVMDASDDQGLLWMDARVAVHVSKTLSRGFAISCHVHSTTLKTLMHSPCMVEFESEFEFEFESVQRISSLLT